MVRRKKTRHGATQPETERTNQQLLLRLPPEWIDWIRQGAEDGDMSMSAYVLLLLQEHRKGRAHERAYE